MLAVRANERGAAAAGISVARTKLAAFALSGAVMGLIAGVITFRTGAVAIDQNSLFLSIRVLVFTIVGGIGFVLGVVYPALTTLGGPISHAFNGPGAIDDFLLAAAGPLVVLILLFEPDGFVALIAPPRDRLLTWVHHRGRRRGAKAFTLPGFHRKERRPVEVRSEATRPAIPVGERLLALDGLTVDYGPVRAVDHVTLEVRAGEVLGVIGPNGAGKTSMIDAVTGFERRSAGRITLRGRPVSRWSAHRRARAGLGRTFQHLELFDGLTVRENLLVASDRRRVLGFVTGWLLPGRARLSATARRACALLDLEHLLDERVEALPYGDQHLVALARALAADPYVVCLDEPAAGLAGDERDAMTRAVRSIADSLHIGVLLIEHNIDVVASLCDRVVVLNFGQLIREGEPSEVLASDAVRAAYLGVSGRVTTLT